MHRGTVGFEDLIEMIKSNIMNVLNCAKIGKIRSFNAANCTGYIEIMQLIPNDGVNQVPTILPDVPILMFGNSGAKIVPPNLSGTNCILLFLDRNIDNFLLTGEQYAPADDRTHSYADCVALLTLNSYIDTPPMYDENALTMYNGTQFTKIFNDSIELYADKIKLYNASTTLLTLINSLIDTIKGIKVDTTTSVTAQPIDTATINALESLKTSFGGLLK